MTVTPEGFARPVLALPALAVPLSAYGGDEMTGAGAGTGETVTGRVTIFTTDEEAACGDVMTAGLGVVPVTGQTVV